MIADISTQKEILENLKLDIAGTLDTAIQELGDRPDKARETVSDCLDRIIKTIGSFRESTERCAAVPEQTEKIDTQTLTSHNTCNVRTEKMKVRDILESYQFVPITKVVIWRECKLLARYPNIMASMGEALQDYGDENVVEFSVDVEGWYMYIRIGNIRTPSSSPVA